MSSCQLGLGSDGSTYSMSVCTAPVIGLEPPAAYDEAYYGVLASCLFCHARRARFGVFLTRLVAYAATTGQQPLTELQGREQ
jgi:hypothetical protein